MLARQHKRGKKKNKDKKDKQFNEEEDQSGQ